MTTADTTAELKLGPIRLFPGVSRANGLTLMYLSFFAVASTVFLSFVQPYVFNEILHIPQDEQGNLAGNLVFFNELVVLLLIGPAGVLSDKIGRRTIWMLGFAMLGLGYILYPLAQSSTELIAYRMVFAVGIVGSTAMLATVQADYPTESSRGKLVGVCGFLQAVGVIVVVFTLSKLPQKLAAGGMTPREAGETALWIFAGFCLFNAGMARFGLKGGVPSAVTTRESFTVIFKRGFAAARKPRIALAYGAAMVSRGDLSTVSTFFSLWLVQVGVAKGLSTQDALAAGGKFFALVQVAALLWAPVVGIICDRIDRVSALCMAMFLAASGYLCAGLLGDPTSAAMYPAAILLGMGEVNAVLAAQALIGQEAPRDGRGAVIGVFGICGGIGILAAGKAGGYLFDAWMPAAPFIIMGSANAVLFFVALAVRLRVGPSKPSTP